LLFFFDPLNSAIFFWSY